MIKENLRKYISDNYPQAVVFREPCFDNSIIGFTDDGNVCYNYDMMIEELSNDNNMSELENIEFIDYNTIRSIPYSGAYGQPPIIIYPIKEGDY